MVSSQEVDFESIFNAFTTPVLVLSPDFTMLAANDARLAATETTREGMIGRSLFEEFPDNPNDPATEGVRNLKASLERVLRDKVADTMAIQKYDIPVRGSTSGEFAVRYWSPRNIPVLDESGAVKYILHIVEDVTTLMAQLDFQDESAREIYRRSEEVRVSNLQLKELKSELERRVQERTVDLRKAKEEAENANSLKSAFLANMSHEIRTPLGAMLGFSALLKERDLTPDERDEYVDTIIKNGNGLISIIDDILDLAKVEAGKLDVEKIEFSLSSLVMDSVELLKDKASNKGIRLSVTIDRAVPEIICSDPSRLRQILVNLIGNAVKFTAEGFVRVHVRSESASETTHRISIDVSDTGIGLTSDQRKRLFQPFVQADNSTTRKYGGTGLGLVLSQRLAHALGGHISISDTPQERGCTFTMTFESTLRADANQLRPHSAPRPRPRIGALNGTHVLAVDDSKDNQFLVSRILTKYGSQVELAGDGEEAVRKALASDFDLVLMDIQMPKMDGYQAKRALDDVGYDKPVVALTAHAMKEERLKTKEAGFVRHLTKPLDTAELVWTVVELSRGIPSNSPQRRPNSLLSTDSSSDVR